MLRILKLHKKVYLTKKNDPDNADKLDQYIIALQNSDLNSKDAQIYYKSMAVLNLLAAFLLYLIGFAIIIIPFPKEYEIMTLYYFNPQDGVTVSDLIALSLIVLGSYLFIKSLKSLT